jgi:hypothetical protein
MSTLIQAKILKARWLSWARTTLHQGCELEASSASLTLKKLRELKSHYIRALSYEVANLSPTDASLAITRGLASLGVELALCVVGDPVEPAVIPLTKKDLEPLLMESARSGMTVALAPSKIDGILIVDMPSKTRRSDLLVSGCGSLEILVSKIQLEVPGGQLFRGN